MKKCKFEGCENEVVNFPNSVIKRKYCLDHAIKIGCELSAKKEKKERSIYKKEKTIDLLSADGYRQKYVQPIFNEIARLIDFGQPCIATGSFNGKMSGGHYFSVGSNRTICLNLHNIHIQSFHSNSAMGGDNIRYREGIIKTYGIAYMEQIEALKLLKPIKMSKFYLIEIREKAFEIRNKLRNNYRILSPKERIELREEINNKIGIYVRDY